MLCIIYFEVGCPNLAMHCGICEPDHLVNNNFKSFPSVQEWAIYGTYIPFSTVDTNTSHQIYMTYH